MSIASSTGSACPGSVSTSTASTDSASTGPASHEPAEAAPHPRLDWRLRFAALSLLWGFSFLLIKVGTDGYAPFQVTLGRLVFGTAVLAVAMAVKRERLPRGRGPGGIWQSPRSCSTRCRSPCSRTPS